jgi:cytoskeletal protein RodZ
MNMHLDSSRTTPRLGLSSRSLPVRLGALALAVLFTAAQMPAQGAPTTAVQASSPQNAGASQTAAQLPTTNTATSTDSAGTSAEAAALPDAPALAGEASDSASLNMPPEMKAMMDDASQVSQNLQSTPSTTNHKLVQRPGMLVLGIAGVPLIVLGTMIFSLNVGSSGKANGLRNGLGTAFLAPGAAMSGIGFYFAFHKKSQ